MRAYQKVADSMKGIQVLEAEKADKKNQEYLYWKLFFPFWPNFILI